MLRQASIEDNSVSRVVIVKVVVITITTLNPVVMGLVIVKMDILHCAAHMKSLRDYRVNYFRKRETPTDDPHDLVKTGQSRDFNVLDENEKLMMTHLQNSFDAKVLEGSKTL